MVDVKDTSILSENFCEKPSIEPTPIQAAENSFDIGEEIGEEPLEYSDSESVASVAMPDEYFGDALDQLPAIGTFF